MRPAADTHESRCLVLANIPRQAMIETIKDHVLKENDHYALPALNEQNHVDWLQSLVDGRFRCLGRWRTTRCKAQVLLKDIPQEAEGGGGRKMGASR